MRVRSLPALDRTLVRLLRQPAHVLSLGFGSGLSPVAPGTAGTLFAWASFLFLDLWLTQVQWSVVIALAMVVGVWCCTLTARALRTADPSPVVWDEIVGFWLVLAVISPASLWVQAVAFGLFRLFDAVKRGPVGWADRLFGLRPGQAITWRQGLSIILDDLVAAMMTIASMATLWAVLLLFASPATLNGAQIH